MSFADIVGHKTPKQILRQAIANNRVPTGYLFVGPPNVGKTTTALEFIKALNCEARPADVDSAEVDACDKCDRCRRITDSSFAYYRTVFPTSGALREEIDKQRKSQQKGQLAQQEQADEEEENYQDLELIEIEDAEIHIEHVRQMLASANLKAPPDVWKTYLIQSAEKMNDTAANHFLKTLEEPPPKTTFILTTSRPSELHDTIVSRCQVIDFGPVPLADACEALTKEFSEREAQQIQAITAASAGRYGWAYRMLSLPELLADREELLDLLAALPTYQLYEGMRQAEVLLDLAGQWFLHSYESDTTSYKTAEALMKKTQDYVLRTAMIQLLDQILSWWRDIILLMSVPGSNGVMNPDRIDRLRELAEIYDLQACRRALRWIDETRVHLRANANLRRTAELLMIKLISLSPAKS